MPKDPFEMTRGRFRGNTAYHQMRILHDDGLYRHLRFKHPTGGSFYWFDLITWPGNLTVNGDCGTYTFARLTDMFEFFRGRQINPQYWAEKLRIGTGSSIDTARSFDEHLFRKIAEECAAEAEADWPGLAADLQAKFWGNLADWDTSYEDEARRALNEYEFGAKWRIECVCGMVEEFADEWWTTTRRIQHSGHGHVVAAPERIPGFRFEDAWELNFAAWDWTYLWCCHAIQWGIGQYDQHHADLEAAAYTEKAGREALVNA